MEQNRLKIPKVGAVIMLREMDDSPDGQVALEVSIPLPLSAAVIRAMAATLAGLADATAQNESKAAEVSRLIRPS